MPATHVRCLIGQLAPLRCARCGPVVRVPHILPLPPCHAAVQACAWLCPALCNIITSHTAAVLGLTASALLVCSAEQGRPAWYRAGAGTVAAALHRLQLLDA